MKRIALIEDNQDVRDSTKDILELADYQVLTAENGVKGLELVKSEIPDLIICDISMPDLDGYTILRILGKNPETSGIPFIFLTARSEKSDIRKGMNLGADDYITKPFEETEILEAIESRLSRAEHLKGNIDGVQHDSNGHNEESAGLGKLEELLKDRKLKSYARKETIYREDDFANYIYYIKRGKIKCVRSDSYGKEFVNDVCGKGEFIGYISVLENGDYGETAKAMDDVDLIVIPKVEFLTLIENNKDVSSKFFKLLTGSVRNREDRLLELAYAPVRERLARALIQLTAKTEYKENDALKIVISREDLANIVGTAKESLIRTLSEFRKDGLIASDGQEITILNQSGLEHLVNY
ncbi:MAG: response regulator [Vicingaceae bacterium]